MVQTELTVGLVIERWAPVSEWGTVSWRPTAVFASAPDVAPWTPLGGDATRRMYYAGAHPLTIYSTETANYRDNLATGDPKLWVVLRPQTDDVPVEVTAVTADPAEGEAFTEPGIDIVETIAMPPEIAAVIAQFIADHHVEHVFEKRKRDRQKIGGYGPGGIGRDGPPGTIKKPETT
jgi:hypothetical protein